MNRFTVRILLLLGLLAAAPLAWGQGAPPEKADAPGLRFNGLGRAYIQQTDLGGPIADGDTSFAERLADGEFLLDLAINAQPNASTEVQGILRLRNEFGGFFGSGVSIEVRELWARGIIANALEYRVGDMNVAMTPYTLFLPDEDGRVNTPELFEPQKDVIYYEEFYTGLNERRLQGARLDFGLEFDRWVDAVDVRAFLARLRPTNFTDTPTRLIGGGRLGGSVNALGLRFTPGFNYVSVWDDLESGNANTGIRNHVGSFDGALSLLEREALSLQLVGEGGWSVAKQADETPVDPTATPDPNAQPLVRETDTFLEIGLAAGFPRVDVDVSAYFVNVGPDFFSAAAQSKRVDYTRSQRQFSRIGAARDRRGIGLFDLTRDPAIYTFRIADGLMNYDPRYNNAQPYGTATANRRGLRLGAEYEPSDGAQAELMVALLREIRGQGTDELKDFALIRGAVDVPIGPLIGYARTLAFSLGGQYEQTTRGGEAIEEVDLTSVLLEAGITAEIYDRLDVLIGVTTRTSSGRDYVPQIRDFNDVRDFPAAFVTDDSEQLYGAGLRYRFGSGSYLTVQLQKYSYGDDATPDDDYTFNQVFALYTLPF